MTDAEREAKIRALLPLVRKIARRISRLVPCDYDDLVGDGSIGLIRAVDNYDPSRGTSLELYARHLISGAMLNGIRRMDPVSERTRRAMRDGEVERYQLACERGNVPTLAEMEIRRPGFIRASAAVTQGVPLSLDRPLPEGERLQRDWSNDPALVVEARHERDVNRRGHRCIAASSAPGDSTNITLAKDRCVKLAGECGSHRNALRNCTSSPCASCARIWVSMLRRLDGEEGRAPAAQPQAAAIAHRTDGRGGRRERGGKLAVASRSS